MALSIEEVEKQLQSLDGKIKEAHEFILKAKFPSIESVSELQGKLGTLQDRYDELHAQYQKLENPGQSEEHHCSWC